MENKQVDLNTLIKIKSRTIHCIESKHGYFSEKISTKQLFPIIFVCRNPKCTAEYHVLTYARYLCIKSDPICVCGFPLVQYLLKD